MKCLHYLSRELGASMKTFFSILVVALAVVWNDATVVKDLGLDENLNWSALIKEVSSVLIIPHGLIGGSPTTIDQYPAFAAVLVSDLSTYTQSCSGTIINTRSILTPASCFIIESFDNKRFRTRVGSTFPDQGGIVHSTSSIMLHPDFNSQTLNNDVAILRLSTTISFNNNVKAASIAGSGYNLNDNEAVWFAGWGSSSSDVPRQVYHVKVKTVNQKKCLASYSKMDKEVTDNMLCTGWLDIGGHDACLHNGGSHLYHNGTLVGILSWRETCGLAGYPTVFTRISRFYKWIQDNA